MGVIRPIDLTGHTRANPWPSGDYVPSRPRIPRAQRLAFALDGLGAGQRDEEVLPHLSLGRSSDAVRLARQRLDGVSGDSSVPEPGTLMLLGTGLLGLGGSFKRRLSR